MTMSAKGRVVFDGIKAMRASFSPFDPRTRGLNELLVRVQAARAKDGAAKTTIEASVRRGAKPAFEVVYEDGRVNTFDGAQPNVVAKVMRVSSHGSLSVTDAARCWLGIVHPVLTIGARADASLLPRAPCSALFEPCS